MNGKPSEAVLLATYMTNLAAYLRDEEDMPSAANRLDETSAELLRLHAVNAELVEALKQIVQTVLLADEEGLAGHAEPMQAAFAALAKAEAAQ